MDETKYMYRCSECGNTMEFSEVENIPNCCEKVMVKDPLTPCTTAEQPEMIRNMDDSEACDDGRGHYT